MPENENEPGKERRKNDAQLEFLSNILVSVQHLNNKVDGMQDVKDMVVQLDRLVREHVESEVNLCKAAFPQGNAEDHRKYHEALIQKANDDRELVLEAKKKIVGWGIGALLFSLLVILVYYWNGHMPSSAHITLPPVR